MTREEFVSRLSEVCRDSAVAGVMELLTRVPGRKPQQSTLELSDWFKSLSPTDKAMVERIAALSAHQCLFGVLCVLDGVRTIRDRAGVSFRLTAMEGNLSNVLLPASECLHDLLAPPF